MVLRGVFDPFFTLVHPNSAPSCGGPNPSLKLNSTSAEQGAFQRLQRLRSPRVRVARSQLMAVFSAQSFFKFHLKRHKKNQTTFLALQQQKRTRSHFRKQQSEVAERPSANPKNRQVLFLVSCRVCDGKKKKKK